MEVTLNYLLVIFIILLVICVIRGSHAGIIRIVYGLISWIFVIWFINFSSPIISDYIINNTTIPTQINTTISDNLLERYNDSEEKETGSGFDGILQSLPLAIKNTVDETIDKSVNNVISVVADELTSTAINGISSMIAIVTGCILAFIIGKILCMIGKLPGLSSINKSLGFVAGVIEALLIIWIIMFLADCFPTSSLGSFVINNSQSDQLMSIIYNNNLIENIIGLK